MQEKLTLSFALCLAACSAAGGGAPSQGTGGAWNLDDGSVATGGSAGAPSEPAKSYVVNRHPDSPSTPFATAPSYPSLYVAGPNSVYLSVGAFQEEVYAYDGAGWSFQVLLSMGDVRFAGSSPNDVWAGDDYEIEHRTASGWANLTSTFQSAGVPFAAMLSLGPSATYFYSSDEVDRYDGQSFAKVPFPCANGLRLDWLQRAGTELWALCGAAPGQDPALGLMRLDGDAWSDMTFTLPSGASSVLGDFAGDESEIWAIDATSTPSTVLHRTDGAFTPVGSAWPCAVSRVWQAGPNDVWFAGAGGCAVHWDGAKSTRVDLGTDANVKFVTGSSPDDIWMLADASNGQGSLVLSLSPAPK